VVSYVPLYLT